MALQAAETDELEEQAQGGAAETDGRDEPLLKELRERYTYAKEQWADIFEEREIDLRYIAGDPWDPKDRKAREDPNARRPCLSHDELNQYVNQAINNLRQNKRGIKIDPDGNGADEKTAELRQDLIRTIEYRSNAQSAYITAYQSSLEGSFGFFRIGRRYVQGDDSTHQELVVRNIANAASVLYDPDCKEADWSDGEYCFVLSPIPRAEFKRRWPKAKIQDFTSYATVASAWVGNPRMVLTAEYWKVDTTEDKRGRKKRSITQYITNGVEILKRTPEPGEILPIIPVLGKEMYLEEDGQAKRRLLSLIRLARDPQMSLAYLVSQEMEEAGLTPKVPYMGYKGQFESAEDAWKNLTKVPVPYIEVDPVTDGAGGEILPLPTRVVFTPNFQQYEVAKDSCRRAIQAAMGVNSLPTAAQRDNQKSGVALDRIESAQAVGSFHFLDNFDRALMLAGRAMDERIPIVYGDEDREMMLARGDETHRRVKLNTKEPYPAEDGTNKLLHYPVDKGTHHCTISTGPWQESQNRAVSEFVDLLVQNLKTLPLAMPQAQQILALGVQMKQLGPKGDKLAEIISPTPADGQPQIPQEAQAAIAQAHQVIEAMQAELQKLQAEKQGKVVDNEYKLQLERMKIEAEIAIAEVNTKAQSLEERMRFVEDAWKQLHGQAHEAGLQAADQAHAQDLATQQQQAAAAQQQQEAAQQPEPAAA